MRRSEMRAASVMIADRTTLSIAKAGELVGVTRRTIYNWIAGGKVEYVRTAGGSVRIFVDTLCRGPHAGVTRPDTHGTWEDVSTPSRGLNVALPRLPAPLRRASPVPWSGAPPASRGPGLPRRPPPKTKPLWRPCERVRAVGAGPAGRAAAPGTELTDQVGDLGRLEGRPSPTGAACR